MLFNSYGFIFLFLPIVLGATFMLARFSMRTAAIWLAIASLGFYASWDSRYVSLLLASILGNYCTGYWIGMLRESAQRRARLLLTVGVCANLGLLGYYKYAGFFVQSINSVFGTGLPALSVVLPLGISFFTFTQIAFLVDAFRGQALERNPIHYLLFVTYFPHLIAGPVLHHKQMMPQFADPRTYRPKAEHLAVGLSIFTVGLAKKVLLADNIAAYASPVFAAAGDTVPLTFVESWLGTVAYALQLYFDFSGYSDMAVGVSLMFNVRLPQNFCSPYKATNIIDFWRRWHITLSAFLRDYLYIPLGGNRKGTAMRHANLMATMLLGGLWHGAGWNFVIWGGLHGLYLIINHSWRGLRLRLGWKAGGRMWRIASWTLTFLAVLIAWVFFRAETFSEAVAILRAMAGFNGFDTEGNASVTGLNIGAALAWLTAGMAIVLLLPNVREMFAPFKPVWDDMSTKDEDAVGGAVRWRWQDLYIWRPSIAYALSFSMLLLACLFNLDRVSEFLYFQF